MARETQPPSNPDFQSTGSVPTSQQPTSSQQQQPPSRRQISSQNSHVFNVPRVGRARPEHHGARGSSNSSSQSQPGGSQLASLGASKPDASDFFSDLDPSAAGVFKRPPTLQSGGSSLSQGLFSSLRVTGQIPGLKPTSPAGKPVTTSPPRSGNVVPTSSKSQPMSKPEPSKSNSVSTPVDDDLFAPVDAWSSRGALSSQSSAPSVSRTGTGAKSPGKAPAFRVMQPTSAPVQNRPAAAPPVFSSSAAPFDPYRPAPGQQFVDLTIPQSRPRKLEIIDVEDYMDEDEANDKLKNLLEGNLGGEDPEDDGDKKDEDANEANELVASMQKNLSISDEKEADSSPVPPEIPKSAEDDGTRAGLNVKLLSHQIVGVKWMNQKETGGKKGKGSPRGGILADDMGLGKTLQTIATIVTNPRPSKDSDEAKRLGIRPSTARCTLIVVPLPLLQQWEGEIAKFVDPGLEYKIHVHYGPKRHTGGNVMLKSDIVLTTYETLVSDFGNSKFIDGGKRVACFEVDWYRVVLDEAHRIKNPSTKQSKACCALSSHYRWCLTGTPMQNKLDEIQSLIRFLAIEPYDNMRHWKDQITNPMSKGKGGLAMRRIQILLKAILLRRTKDLLREKGELKTVERSVVDVVAQFSEQERHIYDNLEDRMVNTIDRMGSKLNYANALVLLLRLRQACNHTELVKTELGKDKDALTTGNMSPSKPDANNQDVDKLADIFGTLDMGGANLGASNCKICGTPLNTRDEKRSGMCVGCGEVDRLKTAGSPQHKRSRGKKGRKGKETIPAREDRSHKSRRGRPIIDDDDDDDDEGEGDWLVPEDQRDALDLSRVGGTDDEDAEGGGESLGEEDSETDDDDDVVGPRSRRGARKQVDSEDESEPEFEDARNGDFSKLKGSNLKVSKRKARPPGLDDESDDSEENTYDDSDDNSDDTYDSELSEQSLLTSAKIRELMKILRRESTEHKVIVFSSFVTMLRLIEPFLSAAGIRYEHYNGQMKNDAREASLNALRNNDRTRVLLCSLKSGALGLNLTAASRVVLIEPFWNPFVEEQAIDRVHRIGQKHDVVVYKLTVGETVEQRIVALQEKKRELARMALESGHKASGAGALTMQQVLALFKRDAEHENDSNNDRQVRDVSAGLLRKDTGGSSDSSMARPRHNPKTGYESRGNKRPEDPIWGRR